MYFIGLDVGKKSISYWRLYSRSQHVRSVRGLWPDDTVEGLVGEDPPYHAPTFVLTHHEREPLEMKGGTTFYFVTGGIDEALKRAKKVARKEGRQDRRRVSTVRQYLQVELIDSLHIASVPVLLGRGESLFYRLDLRALGYSVTGHQASEYATHLTLERG